MSWDCGCTKRVGAALGYIKNSVYDLALAGGSAAKNKIESVAVGEGLVAKTARTALFVINFLAAQPTDKKKSVAKILSRDALVGMGMAYGLKVSVFHPLMLAGVVLVGGTAINVIRSYCKGGEVIGFKWTNDVVNWSISSQLVNVPAIVPKIIAYYSNGRIALITCGVAFAGQAIQLLRTGCLLSKTSQVMDVQLVGSGLMTSASVIFLIDGVAGSVFVGALSIPLVHLLELATSGKLYSALTRLPPQSR